MLELVVDATKVSKHEEILGFHQGIPDVANILVLLVKRRANGPGRTMAAVAPKAK